MKDCSSYSQARRASRSLSWCLVCKPGTIALAGRLVWLWASARKWGKKAMSAFCKWWGAHSHLSSPVSTVCLLAHLCIFHAVLSTNGLHPLNCMWPHICCVVSSHQCTLVGEGNAVPNSGAGNGAKNTLCLARQSAFDIRADWMGALKFLFETKTLLGKELEESVFAFSFGETLFVIITITWFCKAAFVDWLSKQVNKFSIQLGQGKTGKAIKLVWVFPVSILRSPFLAS